jgi:endothelin-converting enzyme
VLVVVLLLLTSVFIGLFAGVQHKLNLEYDRHNGEDDFPGRKSTVTITNTAIATTTRTATSISTAVSTSIATATATTTKVRTSTEVSTTTTTTTVRLPGPTGAPGGNACLTSKCIILSASILASLDTSKDPCEDFYDFANGGWLKDHPLPAAKGRFGNFAALSQQNQQIIRGILESDFVPSDFDKNYDGKILGQLRGLYSSCMDEDLLDARGPGPLVYLVRTLRNLYRSESTELPDGGVDEITRRRDGLTAALSFLHSRGIGALLDFAVEGDIGVDPNYMTLWFSQPSLGLPSKEYYKEDSVVEVYENVLARLLYTLAEEETFVVEPLATGASSKESVSVWPPWPWPPWGDDDDGDKDGNKKEQARRLAKKVVKFEAQLAEASLDFDKLYLDPIGTYNPRPIANLTDTLPQINFADYFSTFTPRAYPTRVIVTSQEYAEELSRILDHSMSDVIEGYLVTRVALSLSSHLGANTEAWKAVRTLKETLQGIKKGAVDDRSEYCVGKVEDALGFAAGRYFVNETFTGDSRTKGIQVITDIIDAFKSSLTEIRWMDKKSAHAAAEKADALRIKVGYPLSPDTQSPGSIAWYYTAVRINEDKFFENMLSAATSDVSKMWAKLGRRRDLEEWEMYPSMVNAYYNPPANEIVFPAGILQPPFFSKDWPAYLSYGSFGHVAAHELTHAFDSSGRLYNQQGKLEEWWTEETSKGFQVKQDCIVKQYSEYTIDDGHGGKIHVNGNLTSGENIGDTGLIQAYRAWKSQFAYSLQAGNEYTLPGLSFTRDQLFFISFARAWAENIKPAAAVQRVRTDPHSPNRYRVDGTVYNIPEFAEAFKCSKNAKLNPPREKQCRFW